MRLCGMQRDTLTFTSSTAEFSYYTCNILEGNSVSVLREKVQLGLISCDSDWYFPTEPIQLCLAFYPKTEIETYLEIWE